MAQNRLSMRSIREILRLRWECGFSYEAIAQSCGSGKTTVGDCIQRATAARLGWPLDPILDDTALERLLYAPPSSSSRDIPAPDWQWVHDELRKRHVTKELLWHEYKAAQPDGYQYTQFCVLFREWRRKLDVVFRHDWRAGERLFVDYAGSTLSVRDPVTGASRTAQIFVAVLAASNYTFAEATWSQELPNWIGSHVRAFEYFGGVPEVVTPDNLKSAVTRACAHEPDLNQTYFAMARHYRTAIIPARPRKPRDKGKGEGAVLIVSRWIIASLRNRTFFSLVELNQAIAELLERLNTRPFKKLQGHRRECFERLERPALKELPAARYEFTYVKQARVNIDYHVEVKNHYYSVPYVLVRQDVEVRFNEATVEILHKNQRVSSHPRSHKHGGFSTLDEHRPPTHRDYVEWSPERVLRWATDASPSAGTVAKAIMENRPHPELGFKAVLGLIRLGRKYGASRLEDACQRAIAIKSPTYRSVKSILNCGLDRKSHDRTDSKTKSIDHPNIRGDRYYQ